MLEVHFRRDYLYENYLNIMPLISHILSEIFFDVQSTRREFQTA